MTIGIIVDDAIVVAANIRATLTERGAAMRKLRRRAVRADDDADYRCCAHHFGGVYPYAAHHRRDGAICARRFRWFCSAFWWPV